VNVISRRSVKRISEVVRKLGEYTDMCYNRRMAKFWMSVMLTIAAHVLCGVAVAGDARPLIVAVSNWAPYKSSELPQGGIITDILKQALVRAGYDVDIRHVPWKRSLKGAYQGVYDVIPAIWLTPERAEKLAYSVPVLKSRVVIISRADANFTFNNLKDLRGQTVGTAAGWAYPKAFEDADYIIKEPVKDLDTNLKKVIYGRIKFTIGDEIAARYAVNAKFLSAGNLLRYSKMSLRESNLHIAFSKKLKNYETVTERFNEALNVMRTDGTFDAVLRFHGVMKTTAELKSR